MHNLIKFLNFLSIFLSIRLFFFFLRFESLDQVTYFLPRKKFKHVVYDLITERLKLLTKLNQSF